jgi:hypothetical protein
VEAVRARALLGGGAKRIATQHSKGKLTARWAAPGLGSLRRLAQQAEAGAQRAGCSCISGPGSRPAGHCTSSCGGPSRRLPACLCRERLLALLDPGSFVESGGFV